MHAIQAKFLPATNTRGARIKISLDGHKPVTVPFDFGQHYNAGVSRETVADYVAECLPYADTGKLAGPFRLNEKIDIWTL